MTDKPEPRKRGATDKSKRQYTCMNCGSRFEGNYCGNCGQHHSVTRLSPHELWDNIAFSLINFDRGIPHTIIALFSRPGQMIKDYLSGHRVAYSHPLSLLILVAAIYGVIVNVLFQAYSNATVPLASYFEIEGIPATIIDNIFNSGLFKSLLPLPFLFWMTKALFKSDGIKLYNNTEVLFINLYMICQSTLIALVTDPMNGVWEYSGTLSLLATITVNAWTMRGILSISWWRALWKTTLIQFISMVLLALFVLFIVFIVVLIIALIDSEYIKP